jgi:hypothetical protein
VIGAAVSPAPFFSNFSSKLRPSKKVVLLVSLISTREPPINVPAMIAFSFEGSKYFPGPDCSPAVVSLAAVMIVVLIAATVLCLHQKEGERLD